MSFMSNLEYALLNDGASYTENGAVGYKSTLNPILDANFGIASFRGKKDAVIEKSFMSGYNFDKAVALTWLFFVRDVRGGLGERNYFRVAFTKLCKVNSDLAIALLPYISEYGRWDDLIAIYDRIRSCPTVQAAIVKIIGDTLTNDFNTVKQCQKSGEKKSISLLGKWMPSENASSEDSIRLGRHFAKVLFPNVWKKSSVKAYSLYRKMLVALREYLDVVEVKMSDNTWEEIDYEGVPSVANYKYRNAFMRHDTERRTEFLDSVEKGEAHINASVAYPHDIVYRYTNNISGYGWYGRCNIEFDTTLEAMWKALPDTVKGNGNTLVVCDGSGSMTVTVGNSNVRALDVSNALAIYFAERASGEFKDKYITFSSHPELVDLSGLDTLRDKLQVAFSHTDCSNTNIEAVFKLILKTAISCHMSQSELPTNVLVISDMEFDASRMNYGANLFNAISKEYEKYGYKLPRLVFWNVNSRTQTVPIRENECGVALVSGFSVNIVDMVTSGELDPYKCLLNVLNGERYAPIREAIKANVKK